MSNTGFIVSEKKQYLKTHLVDKHNHIFFLNIKTQNEDMKFKKKIINHVININVFSFQHQEKMAAKANTYESYNRSVISKAKEGDLLEIYRGCNSHWAVYIGEWKRTKNMSVLYMIEYYCLHLRTGFGFNLVKKQYQTRFKKRYFNLVRDRK